MEGTTLVRFKNNSVSGLERMYQAFRLKIPGSKTVELAVPTVLLPDVTRYLGQSHPAIVVTVIPKTVEPVEEVAVEPVEEVGTVVEPDEPTETLEQTPDKKNHIKHRGRTR